MQLYQQGLVSKKNLVINSLYEKRAEKSGEGKGQDASAQALFQQIDNIDEIIAKKSAEPQSQGWEPGEVVIPSIYELDSVDKRNIPTINYEAHVFASDFKSGFIILNGVRRHIGDQLENGIFVEKISKDEVILSYNGRVFSLPAMKSWSPN